MINLANDPAYKSVMDSLKTHIDARIADARKNLKDWVDNLRNNVFIKFKLQQVIFTISMVRESGKDQQTNKKYLF